MRTFIDTNILLDILIPREDKTLSTSSRDAISAAKQLDMELCIATITVPTLAYVIKGNTSEKKQKLKLLLKNITILDSPASDAKYAMKSKFKDIEDAMQYICAYTNNCSLIITRDEKDFKESELTVMTPKQFLKEIQPES